MRGTSYNTGHGFELARAVGTKMTGDWKGYHSTACDANANADAGQREMTNQSTKSGYWITSERKSMAKGWLRRLGGQTIEELADKLIESGWGR